MFDYENFINTAKILLQFGGEAECRSAVSRVYYAAFHAARNYSSKMPSYNKKETHWEVYEEYQVHQNKNLRELGDSLELLFHRRVEADYFPDMTKAKRVFNREEGKLDLAAAEKIISKIKSLKNAKLKF